MYLCLFVFYFTAAKIILNVPQKVPKSWLIYIKRLMYTNWIKIYSENSNGRSISHLKFMKLSMKLPWIIWKFSNTITIEQRRKECTTNNTVNLSIHWVKL